MRFSEHAFYHFLRAVAVQFTTRRPLHLHQSLPSSRLFSEPQTPRHLTLLHNTTSHRPHYDATSQCWDYSTKRPFAKHTPTSPRSSHQAPTRTDTTHGLLNDATTNNSTSFATARKQNNLTGPFLHSPAFTTFYPKPSSMQRQFTAFKRSSHAPHETSHTSTLTLSTPFSHHGNPQHLTTTTTSRT